MVQKYQALVYTVCHQLVPDVQEAQDLTQETFLAAWRAIDRCPPGFEKQWLARIAANKAKDYLRSAWVRKMNTPGDEVLALEGAPPGMQPEQQVLDALDFVIKMLGTFDITTIRASMGMYLMCKWIHENTDIRVLLTGEISDELFGYKYTDFAPSPEEFQKEAEKRIRELHMYDVLRADRCISVNSLEARVPFGDLDFVRYVLAIDPAKKVNIYGKGKYLLRHAFEGDYLPHDILYREKAAFSDAVGHSMVDHLKAFAEDCYTDAQFEERRKHYAHAQPFTKESLLYREIFEKYYPGQSEMIVDFWMPNKEWEGCDVDDPSARVLSNLLAPPVMALSVTGV